jgi:signal transduction histidine kinase
MHPFFSWALLLLCLMFFVLWLLERRRRATLGKTLTRKWSAQIEQVRMKIDKELEPLYREIKIHERIVELPPIDALGTITELEPIDNKHWNNQLTLLRMTVFRQQQLHEYFRQVAHRKEEELRAFNYTISHDLKTPLNNALYFMDLSLARNKSSIDAELMQFVDQTKSLLLEIRDMIDSIAAYAYADNVALSMQEIDVNLLIQRIVKQLQQSIYPDLNTTVHIQAHIPMIYADPLLIRQAFTNLIINAFKFSKYHAEPLITVEGRVEQDFVQISITDNGAGIPEEGRSQIFQLFHTAHSRSAFEGSGAGLAIVKRILDRHQGSIWVESEGTGKGATFYLKLPVEQAEIIAE